MKNQFIPLNTSQDQNDRPEPVSSTDGWLAARNWDTAGPASTTDALGTQYQPQEGSPPQRMQRPATGKGLLSGWKFSQAQQAADVGYPRQLSLVEQDTLKQPVIQQSMSYTKFAQGQVSPHQSGIDQLPIMPIHTVQSAPTMQAMSPVQVGFPGSGQGQPTLAQQQQAQWAQWQTMGSYQGGPPPFVQGPPGQGQGPQPQGKGRKKNRRFPVWARVAVAMLLVLVILSGTGVYYYEANFAAPVSNIINQQAPLVKGDDNPNLTRGNTDILSGGRINILLLGSDDDQKFQGNYLLAQTDIVVTIDPTAHTVGMLSIPRDLYLNVPGFGMLKLDEAYAYGEKYLKNGVSLSRLTIYQDFGIPINYYAWVGLSGFTKVVTTAGGVDVDVTHPITDDVYPDDTGSSQNAYAYKRLYLTPGPQHLDGPTALEYVRSRHADLVGDFGRSARQQQVLSQLKSKLTSSPDIITKLPELAKDLNGYLKTDMSNILDVIKLMNFARTIDPNKMQRVILSPPTFSSAAVAQSGVDQGEDIFNPICGPIQQTIAKMFALGNSAKCNIQASTQTQPVLATATQNTQPYSPLVQPPPNNSLQTLGQMASMSLNGHNGYLGSDPFGIRSLLDLLFMTVFESPIGLQL